MRSRRSIRLSAIQLFGLRVGVLGDLDDGADVIVGKGRHLPGRPECVVRQTVGERRDVEDAGPLFRLERQGIERPDRRQIRVFRAHPARRVDAEGGDVADRRALSVERIPAFPHRFRPAEAAPRVAMKSKR